MATNSNILAWKIPWTEKPSGLQSMGAAKNQTRLSHMGSPEAPPLAVLIGCVPPLSDLQFAHAWSEDYKRSTLRGLLGR